MSYWKKTSSDSVVNVFEIKVHWNYVSLLTMCPIMPTFCTYHDVKAEENASQRPITDPEAMKFRFRSNFDWW